MQYLLVNNDVVSDLSSRDKIVLIWCDDNSHDLFQSSSHCFGDHLIAYVA